MGALLTHLFRFSLALRVKNDGRFCTPFHAKSNCRRFQPARVYCLRIQTTLAPSPPPEFRPCGLKLHVNSLLIPTPWASLAFHVLPQQLGESARHPKIKTPSMCRGCEFATLPPGFYEKWQTCNKTTATWKRERGRVGSVETLGGKYVDNTTRTERRGEERRPWNRNTG